MDPGYKKTITPVPEDGSRDLLVNFSFSILDILRIDEVKETFTAKISLTREWRDPRLTYKNLKRGNSNQNDLSKEEAESIWYPSVSINNIENVEKMKPTAIEHRARVIPGQKFSYTFRDNSHFFKGSENKLTLAKQVRHVKVSILAPTEVHLLSTKKHGKMPKITAKRLKLA